jgi:choline dehydrogenase-like flavoprotein
LIRDLQLGTPEPGSQADVCIVGAGAVGIVLALELSRLGKSVILLEGGGRLPEEAAQTLLQGHADALHHRGLHQGRARTLGGTTTLWGGQILELDELDFQSRPWIKESGWPFLRTELQPYYQRALELEGLASSIHSDAAVWQAVGAARPQLENLNAYVSRWCPEPNFARLHRQALEGHPNLCVWLHANAVELLMEGERAAGIRCRTLTGQQAVFKASQYAFCLGAIESSRFFLQPREGDLPWNQSGLLGHHFQDHIDCDAATVTPLNRKLFHDGFDAIFIKGYKYNPKVKLDEETQRTHELLNAGATFYSSAGEEDSLAEVKRTAKHLLRGRFNELSVAQLLQLTSRAGTLSRHAWRYGMQHRAWHDPAAPLKMRVHCEQQPDSASTISLSDERDALGMLRPRISWKISPLELKTIRSFVSIATHALRDLATITPHPDLDRDSFIAQCQDSFHHMGGMRMHSSPHSGVVTPDLRLHNTRNVYVCSSATYPTSGYSNPTHTLLALAVRLARHLTASTT